MRDDLWLGRRFADVDIRGPRRMPGLGWRGNVMRFFADPFAGLLALSRRGERLVAIADRHPAFVCAFGPEHNRRLLTDRTDFEPFITPLRAPPGSSLETLKDNPFTTHGEAHRCHRRVIGPPFHRKRVGRYRDTLVGLIDDMMASWQVGEVIDVPHAMQGMTLGAMMAVVFGFDTAESRRGADAFRVMLGDVLEAMGHLGAMVVPVDLPGLPFRRLRKLTDRFVAEVTALVEARRRVAGVDVLSDLIEAQRVLGAESSQALLGDVFALLTAGHETTYAALSWALMLLAAHPRVLGDLFDELHGVLRGEAPQVEQLGALPLLDRVVKESLRVLPTAPYGARLVVRDTEIGGHGLPRGAVVVFSHLVTHHMADVWPEPRRFDPDRWLQADPSPYEYSPFGGGPRACPGSDFALLEMKLTLAQALQRFWPEGVAGRRVDCRLRLTLRPHPGLWLRLRPVGSRIAAVRWEGSVREVVAL